MATETSSTTRPGSNGRGLTAADIMTPSPRTCSPYSTVLEATLLFRDEDCGAVPVVKSGKPVGILTDRDVALAVATYADLANRPVSDIMTEQAVTVPADATVDQIRETFSEAKLRRLLVVDAEGQLLGIIAWSDLAASAPESDVGQVVAEVTEPISSAPKAAAATREPSAPTPARPRAEPEPPRADDHRAQGPWAWARPAAFWRLLKETVHSWTEDKVPRLGAALAFYSVLSLAPLLLIAIAVAGFVFGQEAARGHLVDQIRGMVGNDGAKAIQDMLAHARKPGAGAVATALGIATLLFGASGVFGQLQDAMNTIWEVQPKPGRGVIGFLKDRFLSFAMVLGTGFLLLVSLILSAVVAAALKWFGALMPALAPVLQVGDTLVSFAVITLLFGMIFTVLPDVEISWKDVRVGAVLTALLFLVGKSLIGLYLGRSSYASAYGAAGSLVVLLIWIYYSSQILFFGAEFTKVYANHFGTRIHPSPNAEPLTPEARAEQGIPKTEARATAPPR